MSHENDNLITRLARLCKYDMEALGVKGKTRDRKTVDWWIGAVRGLQAGGSKEDAAWAERVAIWLISLRGYSEVLEIIRKADAGQEEVR